MPSGHRRAQTRGKLLGDKRKSSFLWKNFLTTPEPSRGETNGYPQSPPQLPAVAEWMPQRFHNEPIPFHKYSGAIPYEEDLKASFLEDEGEQVPRRTLRQKLYHTLNGKLDSPIEYFILLLIFFNIILFMIGTVWVDRQTGEISCITLEEDDEDKCIQLGKKYNRFFDFFEVISMGIFTIEYFVRFYACVEDPKARQYEWALGESWVMTRIYWALSFYPMIDLAAIIPTWFELLVPSLSIPGFGILRICRLGRLVKAQDYIDAYTILADVVKQNSALLTVSCWYSFLALVFFSSVLYFTESNWEGDSGVVFASIPKGMFAATLMLTGEFTLDELSPAGEFFALVACLGTIGMITIPVSVIGAGFIDKIQDAKLRKDYIMHHRRMSTTGIACQDELTYHTAEHPYFHNRQSVGDLQHNRQSTHGLDMTDGDETMPYVYTTAERLAALDAKIDSLLSLEDKIDKLDRKLSRFITAE